MDPVTIVTSLIVGTVLKAAGSAVMALTSGQKKVSQPKKSAGTIEQASSNDSPLAVVTEPNGPQIGIFGRGRVGGRVVLSEKSSTVTYKAIVFAGSPVTVNAIYLNNALVAIDGSGNVTSTPWKTAGQTTSYKIKLYDGTQTAADTDLKSAFAGWTNAMIGYKQTYARIEIDPSVHSSYAAVYQAGEPDMTADVSGFPTYDPRDTDQDINNPATWKFTRNSALIGAGYLIHELGRNLPVSAINWDRVAIAAAACDEPVLLASGLSENRYECFLVWKTDERHEDVIERIENSMAGHIYQLGGKYVVDAGTYDDSGAVDIVPDDYEGDGIAFSDTNSLDAVCNGVRGQFASPTNNYELRDYPVYQDAAALSQDGGIEYWLPADFPCVTSASQAQRLARIKYMQARHGAPANVELKFRHFDTVRGDMVRITDPLADMVGVTFRVDSDKLAGDDFVVTLEITRDEAGNYAWSVADEQPMPPVVNLKAAGGAGVNPDNLGALQPPGAVAYVQSGSNSSTWTLVLTLFASPSARAEHYAVRAALSASNSTLVYKPSDYNTGTKVAPVDGTTNNFVFSSIPSGIYNSSYVYAFAFAVKSYAESLGEESAWVTFTAAINANALDNGAPYNSAATSPLHLLPPPPAPRIASQGAGTASLNFYLAAGGTHVTNIELWENTTNNFNTAAKINDVANANGTKTVTGATGQTKYYWTRSRNSADGKTSPVSNVLLVGF